MKDAHHGLNQEPSKKMKTTITQKLGIDPVIDDRSPAPMTLAGWLCLLALSLTIGSVFAWYF